MQDKNIYFKYILFGLVLIILAIFAYFFLSDKTIEPQKQASVNKFPIFEPEISAAQEPVVLEAPAKRIFENYVTGIKMCPLIIDMKYLVDTKRTRNAIDDDAYISIANNKAMRELIDLEVDDIPEGSLEVAALGNSQIKSNTITNWWRSLSISEKRTFNILIKPKSCPQISYELIVSYPPAEEAYVD